MLRTLQFFRRVAKNCEKRLLASSCLSLRPSACNNWASIGRIFIKFDILVVLGKSVEDIQISLEVDKRSPIYILYIFDYISLSFSSFFRDKSCRENQNTYFTFDNLFYLENFANYETVWKNIVMQDRPQKTTWRMRNVCWILEATNTPSEYAIFLLSQCHSGCTNAPECYV
jgi:hypothetical protein